VSDNFNGIPPVNPRKVDDLGDAWSHKASDYSTEVNVGKIVGDDRKGSGLVDIVNLFVNRYDEIRKILRKQCGFRETNTISEIEKEKKIYRRYNIIGIISEVRTTKSGGVMINIEDKSGNLSAFIRKEDSASQSLLVDDVVGITGSYGKESDIFWVDRVQFGDILPKHLNKGGKDFDPVSIAFISDIHMGSKYFLEDTWDKMMKWMNEDELATNIKYLVMAGDVCDGIGIYPGQENNLIFDNAYDQYEMCARKLDELPDHITPIILPGNHDAVRPAQPQPMLEHTIQQQFNSAIHTGNPCRANLSGIELLAYHGQGMDDIIPQLDHVTYEDSIQGMKEMLKRRHMTPQWGERSALSPEQQDDMVIKELPDIFVTGHTHSHAYEWYKGVPCVVSSTMQGQTDFMNMLGYASEKGFLTLYNIQNREAKVVPFHANDDIDF
jgi:DNA polymerase II small subunit|tara:strand:- start:9606 stop:10919 length:1314 start_codon:yes stop_codon:yes gene_type:complete